METMTITSITSSNRYVMINIIGFDGNDIDFANILNFISNEGITLDIMNHFVTDEREISFAIKDKYVSEFKSIIPRMAESFNIETISINKDVAKISLFGIGVKNAGVASQSFASLFKANVDIKMISCSAISIHCIISEQNIEKALKALNEVYFN